jgi:ubiquinone/menaquinone biosynthesis C-methylase UbiE
VIAARHDGSTLQQTTYSLETEREFERLEYQSSLPQFDYRVELRELEVPPGARVLDAGTGSGIVARHLASRDPSSRVVGCDLSEQRVARAQEAGRALANLTFAVEDLRRLRFADEGFDVVVCRYVLEHLDPVARQQALSELVRCLAPGGRLCLVDVDGAFTSVHPALEPLPELIARLRSDDRVDLDVGRKLPGLLLAAGLGDVRTRIEPLYYRHDEVESATKILGWTLDAVQPYLAHLLGSEDKAEAARRAYLDAVRAPGGLFFCHKFIVTGQKPSR